METTDSTKVADKIRAVIRSEPRFDPKRDHVKIAFKDGIATLVGDVGNVAVKKLAMERTAALAGVVGIVDRLHVTPAQPMGDSEIRVLVRDALLQEPALVESAIYEKRAGRVETIREPPDFRGVITIAVDDGVVTLDGDSVSLAHKRIAGVLAWWVPGSRDVINGIGELSPEGDFDGELTDAIRMVLEKDPFVDASQIRVRTQDAVVLLLGLVPTESEREMAEFDAWYVIGVDRVENRIEVRA
jgi:osmotically-inducible protein OsmY